MIFGQVSWIAKVVRLVSVALGRLSRDAEIAALAKTLPEPRSGQIIVYDEYGNQLTICLTVSRTGVRYKPAPCTRPTNTVRMHIDVLLDILEGRVDFRTAVAHGLVTIESHDGRPWFYHFVLWSQVWDVIQRKMRGQQ